PPSGPRRAHAERRIVVEPAFLFQPGEESAQRGEQALQAARVEATAVFTGDEVAYLRRAECGAVGDRAGGAPAAKAFEVAQVGAARPRRQAAYPEMGGEPFQSGAQIHQAICGAVSHMKGASRCAIS